MTLKLTLIAKVLGKNFKFFFIRYINKGVGCESQKYRFWPKFRPKFNNLAKIKRVLAKIKMILAETFVNKITEIFVFGQKI